MGKESLIIEGPPKNEQAAAAWPIAYVDQTIIHEPAVYATTGEETNTGQDLSVINSGSEGDWTKAVVPSASVEEAVSRNMAFAAAVDSTSAEQLSGHGSAVVSEHLSNGFLRCLHSILFIRK